MIISGWIGQVAQGANLIPNGNFNESDPFSWYIPELGGPGYPNMGFTSEYMVRPETTVHGDGTYAIGSNPRLANESFVSISDYTGDGRMLIVNGAAGANANKVVWQVDIHSLNPNTNYEFSAHVININDINYTPWVHSADGAEAWKAAQSILEFQILEQGQWVTLGNIVDFTDPLVDSNLWTGINDVWNSGSLTSTSIRLINHQTALDGNDFAVDGISFNVNAKTVPNPEPGSMLSLMLGMMYMLSRRRRH